MTAPYAAVRETHSGVVILLGPWAIKIKKPVTLPFLDFSTAGLRLAACTREVDLNRRLAPDVYLGVGSLSGPDGIAEPTVMMRRMPDERRMSTLILDGSVNPDDVRALARLLADFHARAERDEEIAAHGTRDAVRSLWQSNLDQVDQQDALIPADLRTEIRARSLRYLAGREPLFAERISAGRIVDGHGDLLADDIFFLDDGPRVLDCLEFDDRLRHLDQIDDVACLVMDLERLGRADVGADLLTWYQEFTGDAVPMSLVHHYIAYRAFMRAKVSSVRQAQAPGEAPAGACAEDPERLSRLAVEHLHAAEVRIILVGGAPGTGKSTLAEALGGRTGAVVLRSDQIRKELAGLDPLVPAGAPFGEGLYGADWTDRTYRELLHRARLLVGHGNSVILDASWRDPRHRDAAQLLAAETSTGLVQLQCEVDATEAARRIRHRHDISDADEQIAAMIRDLQPGWPGSVTIDTTPDPVTVTETALAVLAHQTTAPTLAALPSTGNEPAS